jgi:hypothetical protein
MYRLPQMNIIIEFWKKKSSSSQLAVPADFCFGCSIHTLMVGSVGLVLDFYSGVRGINPQITHANFFSFFLVIAKRKPLIGWKNISLLILSVLETTSWWHRLVIGLTMILSIALTRASQNYLNLFRIQTQDKETVKFL